MWVKKQQLESSMQQQTDWKLGKEYHKAIYCHFAYLTYVQSMSSETPGWMNHKPESRRNINNLRYADLLRFSHSVQRRQWHPTPVLLPGKSHGWRSLVGCSLWGRKESDTTEWLHFHFSLSYIGEGNGNPPQCSCLENPRDGGAWWAAVYGVAQSWTRLKRLSSSSSSSHSIASNSLWLFATTALRASLSFTISHSLLKLMSMESVMPSNHLILCRPLLLPSVFPSISLL